MELLYHNFDPNVLDTYSEQSMLDLCRKTRKLDAMILLLALGKQVNPNLKNADKSTALGSSLREWLRKY